MSQETTLPPLPRAAVDENNLQGGRLLYTRNQMHAYARAAIAAQAQQAQGVSVAAEYRRGWDECMALWADHMKRMNEALNAPSKVGYFNRAAELYQNVKTALAAAPQAVQKESHAELDLHSNPARDEQQRPLVGALEMGQPLGGGQNESASNSQPKGAIARISGMDEYGPMLEWYTHWANFKIGTEIYAAAPQAEPALDKTRNHLSTMIGLVLGARQRGAAYEAGSAIDKAVQEAIEHLKNWPQAPAVEAEPQPEREPLTDAQIEKLREQTFSTSNPFCPCDSKTMRKAVWAAERAHGIGTKGGE